MFTDSLLFFFSERHFSKLQPTSNGSYKLFPFVWKKKKKHSPTPQPLIILVWRFLFIQLSWVCTCSSDHFPRFNCLDGRDLHQTPQKKKRKVLTILPFGGVGIAASMAWPQRTPYSTGSAVKKSISTEFLGDSDSHYFFEAMASKPANLCLSKRKTPRRSCTRIQTTQRFLFFAKTKKKGFVSAHVKNSGEFIRSVYCSWWGLYAQKTHKCQQCLPELWLWFITFPSIIMP